MKTEYCSIESTQPTMSDVEPAVDELQIRVNFMRSEIPCHDQEELEHAVDGERHADAAYRHPYKEVFVTQSPEVKSRAVSVLNKMLQLRSGRASESGMSGRSRLNDSSALNDCTLNRCLPAYEKLARPPTAMSLTSACDLKAGNEGGDTVDLTNSMLSDGRSTIRERVPRGQTRHLASMFETLADVAVTEVTLGRFDVERMSWSKRNKSVPPPTATGRNHQQSSSRTTLTQKSAAKMTEDDFFLLAHNFRGENRFANGTPLHLKVFYEKERCYENGDANRVTDHLPYMKDVVVGKVRFITNQFENASAKVSDSVAADSQSRGNPRRLAAPNILSPSVQRLRNECSRKCSCVITNPSSRPAAGCGAIDLTDNDYKDRLTPVTEGSFEQRNSRYTSASQQVMPHGKCERLQGGRMRENKDELCYMCKGINLKTESSNTSVISEESLFDGHRSRGCRECTVAHMRELRSDTNMVQDIAESNSVYSFTENERSRLVEVARNMQMIGSTVHSALSAPVSQAPHTCDTSLPSYSPCCSGRSMSVASDISEISDERNNTLQIKRVSEELLVQKERLSRALAAVTKCRKKNNFTGTLAEICAQREFILCYERDVVLRQHLERLKTRRFNKVTLPRLSRKVRTSLDIHSIAVYLDHEVYTKNANGANSYAFVAVLKSDEYVKATEAVTVVCSNSMKINAVHFKNHIHFVGLPLNFVISIDIHAMRVHEGEHANKYSGVVMKNNAAKSIMPPYAMNSINSSLEFVCCGSLLLNRDAVGVRRLHMEDFIYPLEGTIELKSRCTALPPLIETAFRGFLTVCEGEGEWVRYWSVLRSGMLHFWKCLDDEASDKRSVINVDLTKCVDKKVVPLSRGLFPCPSNTFGLNLLIEAASVSEIKRVLLSAETKEVCAAWIDAINETLDVLRA
uniref:Anillin-like protein 2 n=1 Tax=Ascaris suum TaxID=6253 RepID=F1KRE9_ASCSU